MDFKTQLRVQEIIYRLDLKALQASKVIPKIWDKQIEDLKSFEVDHCVISEQKIKIRNMISKKCNQEKISTPKPVQKFKNCDEMCDYLNRLDIGQFDQELYMEYKNGSSIVGHPDLFSDFMISDIKTTNSWSSDRMSVIARLCIYSILSNVNKICVILPLSNTCAFHTFENMQAELYDLKRVIYNTLEFHPYAQIHYFEEKYNVGYHMSKSAVVENYNILKNKTIQIFLGSPQSSSVPKIDSSIMEKLQTVAKNNKLFVHAPYTVLLSSEQKYVVKSIQDTMQLASKIGVLGVVYHIGSGTEEAMRNNLKQIEPFIEKECPLIIETSCGEGNEILVKKDELLNFVKQLDSNKFKMCCDTCHMYTSPNSGTVYESIKYYESHIPGIISITHFNNSAHPRKSRKDRHAHYWGFLSFDLMDSVANFCFERNIPMVFE